MMFSHCTFDFYNIPSEIIAEIYKLSTFNNIMEVENKKNYTVLYTPYKEVATIIIYDTIENMIIADLDYHHKDGIGKQIFRCLRYINESEMRKKGMCFFHAAALEINKKGIILTADKFSGKTTLLIKLLKKYSNKDTFFIANDKIAVQAKNTKDITLYSSPISIGVRIDTYEKYISALSKLQLNEILNEGSQDPKIFLSIKELEKIFNTQYKNYSTLKYIFKPNYIENSNFSYKFLGEIERKKFIDSQLLTFMTDFPFRLEYQYLFENSEQFNDSLYDFDIIELTYGENRESQNKLFRFLERLIYDE